MVAEGGVVQLGRIHRLDHLESVVVLAEETGTQDVAGQDEEDLALVGQAVSYRRDPRQAAIPVAESVGDVDVVDEE